MDCSKAYNAFKSSDVSADFFYSLERSELALWNGKLENHSESAKVPDCFSTLYIPFSLGQASLRQLALAEILQPDVCLRWRTNSGKRIRNVYILAVIFTFVYLWSYTRTLKPINIIIYHAMNRNNKSNCVFIIVI